MKNSVNESSNTTISLNDIIFSSGIDLPDTPTVDIIKDRVDTDESNSDIEEMNALFGLKQRIYERVLSPQLEINEDLKRQHKNVLMRNIFKILKWQFIFTYIFVSILLISVILSQFLSLDAIIIKTVINFIEFYITSIVVELISILFFIVQNVFDKSIVDLFSNFDKQKKKKNRKQKK